MVKLDENVKMLFADMRAMAAKALSAERKTQLRKDIDRLIELVPVESKNSNGETLLVRAAEHGDEALVR